jgi:hypothetical protein
MDVDEDDEEEEWHLDVEEDNIHDATDINMDEIDDAVDVEEVSAEKFHYEELTPDQVVPLHQERLTNVQRYVWMRIW